MSVDTSVISGRMRALGYPQTAKYADYLASEHWRAVKRRYADSELPQDCSCGAPAALLHHKTYERLGAEKLTDLEPVCRRCHGDRHPRKRRRRKAAQKPKYTVRYMEPDPRPRDWHYTYEAGRP